MKTSHMTTKRCIEDLKTLKAYFIQKSTFGAYPECIDYAIEQLEKQEKATENHENFVEPQAVTSEHLDVKED